MATHDPGEIEFVLQAAQDSDVKFVRLWFHSSFIQNKKIEWEDYRSTVTDYEISRYLPIL